MTNPRNNYTIQKQISNQNQAYILKLLDNFDFQSTQGIDSIRGIITQSALQKIKRRFEVSQGTQDKKQDSTIYKLDKAFLKVYHLTASKNETALQKAQDRKRPLDYFVFIEIFGLYQYNQKSNAINQSKRLLKLIQTLLRESEKERKSFYLESLDIAQDLKLRENEIKSEISLDIAYSLIEKINQSPNILKDMFYPQTLYLQHNHKKNIAPYLSKVCIYDKNAKDKKHSKNLKHDILRVEFTINLESDYFQDTSSNFSFSKAILKRFEELERSQTQEDREKLEKLKLRYSSLYQFHTTKHLIPF